MDDYLSTVGFCLVKYIPSFPTIMDRVAYHGTKMQLHSPLWRPRSGQVYQTSGERLCPFQTSPSLSAIGFLTQLQSPQYLHSPHE